MANFAALESRRRSSTSYQASWPEHRVRQGSRRIRPVRAIPSLPVRQIQFTHVMPITFAFICKRPDYAINGDYEVSIAIEKVIIPVPPKRASEGVAQNWDGYVCR